jgi:hypothetical protein
LVKENYPIYDYRLEGAYIPAQLAEASLSEFFAVLTAVHSFENEVGFRIEFPNNRHLKTIVFPLLQILRDNKSSLIAVSNRLDLLVISSVYNYFAPGDKVLMLKIDDLRKSFADLWTFMSLFFKAHDLFGDVSFDFDKGDISAETTMNKLFQNSATFAPLLSKLQGRSISLFAWEYYAYSDANKPLMDLGISSSHDEKYLAEVFQDQIRVIELSNFIGKRIYHSSDVIDLQDHNDCLKKIDSLKSSIKAKVSFIQELEVGSGQIASRADSSFADRKLYLNCNQPIEEMTAAVDRIK